MTRHTVDTITSDALDALYERLANAEKEADAERYKQDYLKACTTIAAMHAAATGRDDRGPDRGVVEDVADVRARMLAAEEALTNEQRARSEASQLSHEYRTRAEHAEAALACVRKVATAIRDATAAGRNDWQIGQHDCALTILAALTEPAPAAAEATELEKTARVFAALHQSAEQDVTRVIGLYERWVKAGPPPLGTSLARWWDARLVELHDAIRPPADGTREQP